MFFKSSAMTAAIHIFHFIMYLFPLEIETIFDRLHLEPSSINVKSKLESLV